MIDADRRNRGAVAGCHCWLASSAVWFLASRVLSRAVERRRAEIEQLRRERAARRQRTAPQPNRWVRIGRFRRHPGVYLWGAERQNLARRRVQYAVGVAPPNGGCNSVRAALRAYALGRVQRARRGLRWTATRERRGYWSVQVGLWTTSFRGRFTRARVAAAIRLVRASRPDPAAPDTLGWRAWYRQHVCSCPACGLELERRYDAGVRYAAERAARGERELAECGEALLAAGYELDYRSATSVYYRRGDHVVRLSDHHVPWSPEREYDAGRGRRSWATSDDQIVFPAMQWRERLATILTFAAHREQDACD